MTHVVLPVEGTDRQAAFELTRARARFILARITRIERPYTHRPRPLAELYPCHWAYLVSGDVPPTSPVTDTAPPASPDPYPFDRLEVSLAGARMTSPCGLRTSPISKAALQRALNSLPE